MSAVSSESPRIPPRSGASAQPGSVGPSPPPLPSGGASGSRGATVPNSPDPTDSVDRTERALAADAAAAEYRSFVIFTALPAWLISLIFHMILLLALALINLAQPVQKMVMSLTSLGRSETSAVEEFAITEIATPTELVVETEVGPTVPEIAAEVPLEVATNVSAAADLTAAPVAVELSNFGEQTAPKSDLLRSIGAVAGTGFAGRGSSNRSKMVKAAGGTDASERAVALALRWLAEHQLQDGSWNFDHRLGPCQGRCAHPGNLNQCTTGATAMALLPFLGAGQTHREGQYKRTVAAGLGFLVRSIKNDGSLVTPGGSMYAHGLAAITLCEAYGMTQDRQLLAPAQASLGYIVYAQDPVGGGWRYQPRQPGDTSVVGWQLMALKSGHMSYLAVPPGTVAGVSRFLDSVQTASGSRYGYTGPGEGPATTAVGLLCRMYLGWKKDHPGMKEGIAYLSTTGPSKTNMYYNYYATQVLRHFEGPEWDNWNKVMREQLVTTQSNEGHMTGSWFVAGGDHGTARGGRLYCTSLATMILEVYYRHMPLYAKAATEEEFPLK